MLIALLIVLIVLAVPASILVLLIIFGVRYYGSVPALQVELEAFHADLKEANAALDAELKRAAAELEASASLGSIVADIYRSGIAEQPADTDPANPGGITIYLPIGPPIRMSKAEISELPIRLGADLIHRRILEQYGEQPQDDDFTTFEPIPADLAVDDDAMTTYIGKLGFLTQAQVETAVKAEIAKAAPALIAANQHAQQASNVRKPASRR